MNVPRSGKRKGLARGIPMVTVKLPKYQYDLVKFPMGTSNDMNTMIRNGWDITFEGGPFVNDNDPDWQAWTCYLYYGDSNSPWKDGTVQSEGTGKTTQEAFEDAQARAVISRNFRERTDVPE